MYRLLQRFGVSQRRIAALTDQSQSEVSEIIGGRRHVVSYDLLVRIADGLGVPRGWMGLSSHATARTMAVQDGEISLKQAAQQLGIPADAIYNWLRHRRVPANTRAGRWCIPWDAETHEIYRQKVANSFRLKPNPPVADTDDVLHPEGS